MLSDTYIIIRLKALLGIALTLLRGLSTLTVLKVLSSLELDEPESDNSTILEQIKDIFLTQ